MKLELFGLLSMRIPPPSVFPLFLEILNHIHFPLLEALIKKEKNRGKEGLAVMVTDGNEGQKGEDEEWKAPIEWLRRPPGKRKRNMDNRKREREKS